MKIEPLNFVTAIRKEEVYESTAEAVPLTLNTIKDDIEYEFVNRSTNFNILNELWFKSTPETEELYKEKTKMRVWLRKNAKEEYAVLNQRLKDEMEVYSKEFNELGRSMKKTWDGFTRSKDEPKLDAIGKEWAQKEYEMIKRAYEEAYKKKREYMESFKARNNFLFEEDSSTEEAMDFISQFIMRVNSELIAQAEKKRKEREEGRQGGITQDDINGAGFELSRLKMKYNKKLENLEAIINDKIRQARGDENALDRIYLKKQDKIDEITTNFMLEVDNINKKYGLEESVEEIKESLLYEVTRVIKSFAAKSGKSIEEVENLWKKAKEQANKQGKKPSDGFSYYRYVTGILKKMLSIKESEYKGRDLLWNEYAFGESIPSLYEGDSDSQIENQRDILIKNYKIEYQKLMDDEYREQQDATRKLWPLLKNYAGPLPSRGFIQLIKDLLFGRKPIAGEPTINFKEIYAAVQEWKRDRQRHWVTVQSSGLGSTPIDPKRGIQITADAAYQEAMTKYGVDIERLIDEYNMKNKMLAMKYQEEWAFFLKNNGRRVDKLTDLTYFRAALEENVSSIRDTLYNSIDRICVPCSDGNYILAERHNGVINFYHGVAIGAKEQKEALKYYPSLLNFGKRGH